MSAGVAPRTPRAERARPTAHRPAVRRGTVPRAPRRVSGPARPPRRSVAAAGGAVALPQPLAPRLADLLRGLPDSRWLDKLIRGQGWIVLIGLALIGIVAMQVHLLKLNAGIGRAVEHTATLERQNADLRAAVSRMSSPERIQQVAARQGLLMPAAGDVRYVTARGREDARRAAKIMRAPNPRESATALATTEAAAPNATVAAGTTTTPAPAGATAAPTGTTPTPGTTTAPGATAAPGTATAPGTAAAPGTTAAPSTTAPATTAPAPTPGAAAGGTAAGGATG